MEAAQHAQLGAMLLSNASRLGLCTGGTSLLESTAAVSVAVLGAARAHTQQLLATLLAQDCHGISLLYAVLGQECYAVFDPYADMEDDTGDDKESDLACALRLMVSRATEGQGQAMLASALQATRSTSSITALGGVVAIDAFMNAHERYGSPLFPAGHLVQQQLMEVLTHHDAKVAIAAAQAIEMIWEAVNDEEQDDEERVTSACETALQQVVAQLQQQQEGSLAAAIFLQLVSHTGRADLVLEHIPALVQLLQLPWTEQQDAAVQLTLLAVLTGLWRLNHDAVALPGWLRLWLFDEQQAASVVTAAAPAGSAAAHAEAAGQQAVARVMPAVMAALSSDSPRLLQGAAVRAIRPVGAVAARLLLRPALAAHQAECLAALEALQDPTTPATPDHLCLWAVLAGLLGRPTLYARLLEQLVVSSEQSADRACELWKRLQWWHSTRTDNSLETTFLAPWLTQPQNMRLLLQLLQSPFWQKAEIAQQLLAYSWGRLASHAAARSEYAENMASITAAILEQIHGLEAGNLAAAKFLWLLTRCTEEGPALVLQHTKQLLQAVVRACRQPQVLVTVVIGLDCLCALAKEQPIHDAATLPPWLQLWLGWPSSSEPDDKGQDAEAPSSETETGVQPGAGPNAGTTKPAQCLEAGAAVAAAALTTATPSSPAIPYEVLASLSNALAASDDDIARSAAQGCIQHALSVDPVARLQCFAADFVAAAGADGANTATTAARMLQHARHILRQESRDAAWKAVAEWLLVQPLQREVLDAVWQDHHDDNCVADASLLLLKAAALHGREDALAALSSVAGSLVQAMQLGNPTLVERLVELTVGEVWGVWHSDCLAGSQHMHEVALDQQAHILQGAAALLAAKNSTNPQSECTVMYSATVKVLRAWTKELYCSRVQTALQPWLNDFASMLLGLLQHRQSWDPAAAADAAVALRNMCRMQAGQHAILRWTDAEHHSAAMVQQQDSCSSIQVLLSAAVPGPDEASDSNPLSFPTPQLERCLAALQTVIQWAADASQHPIVLEHVGLLLDGLQQVRIADVATEAGEFLLQLSGTAAGRAALGSDRWISRLVSAVQLQHGEALLAAARTLEQVARHSTVALLANRRRLQALLDVVVPCRNRGSERDLSAAVALLLVIDRIVIRARCTAQQQPQSLIKASYIGQLIDIMPHPALTRDAVTVVLNIAASKRYLWLLAPHVHVLQEAVQQLQARGRERSAGRSSLASADLAMYLRHALVELDTSLQTASRNAQQAWDNFSEGAAVFAAKFATYRSLQQQCSSQKGEAIAETGPATMKASERHSLRDVFPVAEAAVGDVDQQRPKYRAVATASKRLCCDAAGAHLGTVAGPRHPQQDAAADLHTRDQQVPAFVNVKQQLQATYEETVEALTDMLRLCSVHADLQDGLAKACQVSQ